MGFFLKLGASTDLCFNFSENIVSGCNQICNSISTHEAKQIKLVIKEEFVFLREIPFLNFWGWVGSFAWIIDLDLWMFCRST